MTNITAKIRTRELGTKLINVLACGLFFSHMIGFSLVAWFSLHGFPGLTVTLANHGVCSNPGTQVGNQSKDFRAVLQTDLSDA